MYVKLNSFRCSKWLRVSRPLVTGTKQSRNSFLNQNHSVPEQQLEPEQKVELHNKAEQDSEQDSELDSELNSELYLEQHPFFGTVERDNIYRYVCPVSASIVLIYKK